MSNHESECVLGLLCVAVLFFFKKRETNRFPAKFLNVNTGFHSEDASLSLNEGIPN